MGLRLKCLAALHGVPRAAGHSGALGLSCRSLCASHSCCGGGGSGEEPGPCLWRT